MTARYELLIKSMQASSEAVLITFLFAMLLLLVRHAIRRVVTAPAVTVFFRDMMYNAGDVLLILPVYALIILSA